MEGKRSADASMALVATKRSKGQEIAILSSSQPSTQQIVAAAPARTSGLLAPTMLLEGHQDAIYTCQYSPKGQTIASAGHDRQIYLWDVFGECDNYAVLPGHTGAINDVKYCQDGSQLYSASTDKTTIVWDVEAGGRVRKLKGHSDIVNAVSASRHNNHTLATFSDDCTIRVWDSRRKGAVKTLSTQYQVLCGELSQDGDMVYSAGIDNVVKMWDLRSEKVLETFKSHTDSVTGMALSPDGKRIITNGMDNKVCMWDAQPYATSGARLLKTFTGAMHNFEQHLIKLAWTPDGKHIGCGSADRNVYVWEVFSQRVVYCLPGHKGPVTQVAFHPEEPIILSCSTDKKMYQGELHL